MTRMLLNDGFGGPTFDELVDDQPSEVANAINEIIAEAGTSDGESWSVWLAAGQLIANARREKCCLNLLKPETKVEFGPDADPICGTIRQACINGPQLAVQYEVAWWAIGERKTQWLDASEVREVNGDRVAIGFKP